MNDKHDIEFGGIDVDNHYCIHLLSVFLPFKNTFYYILWFLVTLKTSSSSFVIITEEALSWLWFPSFPHFIVNYKKRVYVCEFLWMILRLWVCECVYHYIIPYTLLYTSTLLILLYAFMYTQAVKVYRKHKDVVWCFSRVLLHWR